MRKSVWDKRLETSEAIEELALAARDTIIEEEVDVDHFLREQGDAWEEPEDVYPTPQRRTR